jgi:hypothetical protein
MVVLMMLAMNVTMMCIMMGMIIMMRVMVTIVANMMVMVVTMIMLIQMVVVSIRCSAVAAPVTPIEMIVGTCASTDGQLPQAVHYANGVASTVFEMKQGMVDRGACLSDVPESATEHLRVALIGTCGVPFCYMSSADMPSTSY